MRFSVANVSLMIFLWTAVGQVFRICQPVHGCDVVNCEWANWLSWNSCTKTCDSGYQVRVRTYARYEECGGAICAGSSSQTRPCNTECCPQDCIWGNWGPSSACSASCGDGHSTRSRVKSVPATCGGRCAGLATRYSSCTSCCPINCRWGSWSSYGSCTVTCGNGTFTRTRQISTPAQCGGSSCLGPNREEAACNTQCCPVDCRWGPWSPFSSCSATCGGGTQKRRRNVVAPSSCGGKTCGGLSEETTTCNTHHCAVDCPWRPWSSCSVTCGNGTQRRQRTSASGRGNRCQDSSDETRVCNGGCCPTNGKWGSWSTWGVCSRTCGLGTQRKTRFVARNSSCGGVDVIGNAMEQRTCNNNTCCPVDCRWTEWSNWESCSKTCGIGGQFRFRTVLISSKCGGKTCSVLNRDKRICKISCCPVDCQMSSWSAWTNCTAACDLKESSYRSRMVMLDHECGGKVCPEATQKRWCNNTCPTGSDDDRTGQAGRRHGSHDRNDTERNYTAKGNNTSAGTHASINNSLGGPKLVGVIICCAAGVAFLVLIALLIYKRRSKSAFDREDSTYLTSVAFKARPSVTEDNHYAQCS